MAVRKKKAKTKTKRRGRRLPVALKNGEVELLLGQINTRSPTGLRNRAALQAMVGAGLRVGEVVALMPADVDLDEGLVRVNKGKGAKDRVVPIDGETTGWLRAWAEKRRTLGFTRRHPFFCNVRSATRDPRTGQMVKTKGRPLAARYLQQLVSGLAAKAEIDKRVTPHTLRHTYATVGLRAKENGGRGLNLRQVQALLGHSSVATTQIYTHVDPQELREAIQGKPEAEDLDARLIEALKGLTPEAKAALAKALGA